MSGYQRDFWLIVQLMQKQYAVPENMGPVFMGIVRLWIRKSKIC